MPRATSKLTPEDLAWLERRLSDAIAPVAPSPEFVLRAKRQLMSSPTPRPLPAWVKRGVLAAVALSLISLVATLLYLRQRE